MKSLSERSFSYDISCFLAFITYIKDRSLTKAFEKKIFCRICTFARIYMYMLKSYLAILWLWLILILWFYINKSTIVLNILKELINYQIGDIIEYIFDISTPHFQTVIFCKIFLLNSYRSPPRRRSRVNYF